MVTGNRNDAAQALLRSSSDDGTCWVFVIRPDRRWAITRNGEQVAFGASNYASVSSGLQMFLSLTAAGRPQPVHGASWATFASSMPAAGVTAS